MTRFAGKEEGGCKQRHRPGRRTPASGCPTAALLAWAARFHTLVEFREEIAGARGRLTPLHRDNAPLILATVHGTKGLEFEHVAVVGLDEGRFPSRRSREDSEDPVRALEEERPLTYVAWTYAKRSSGPA